MTLTQRDTDGEMAARRAAYRRNRASGGPAADHPPRDYPPSRSSALRHPTRPPVTMADDRRRSSCTGPSSATPTSPSTTPT